MPRPRLVASLHVLGRSIFPSTRPVSILARQQPFLQRAVKPAIIQPFTPVRNASHATQGAANRHASRPDGKRLGAKRTGGEYVVPGCIIFRQKGTAWFPGENCAMGRDHSIYATERGYVRYYLDPERHPKRKYIGIALEKDGKLPLPRNAPSKRRLNKVLAPRLPDKITKDPVAVVAGELGVADSDGNRFGEDPVPRLRPGYMYREGNWEIGRAAEKAGITAKPFDRNNRWLAWRRRQAKVEHAIKIKSLRGKNKNSKKKKKDRSRS